MIWLNSEDSCSFPHEKSMSVSQCFNLHIKQHSTQISCMPFENLYSSLNLQMILLLILSSQMFTDTQSLEKKKGWGGAMNMTTTSYHCLLLSCWRYRSRLSSLRAVLECWCTKIDIWFSVWLILLSSLSLPSINFYLLLILILSKQFTILPSLNDKKCSLSPTLWMGCLFCLCFPPSWYKDFCP